MTQEKFTVDRLHSMVLREIESDTVMEMDGDTYQDISRFVGSLRRQAFDGIENEVRDSMVETVLKLVDILLRTRLEKSLRSDEPNPDNLLDEEKYILDAEEEKRSRIKLVISATSRGKTRLLEHISNKHKTRMVAVRFLKDVDALTGSDYNPYGPFLREDIATIPHDNAKALVLQGSAVRVVWVD